MYSGRGEQQRVGRLDLPPQGLDRRREALGAYILVIERELRDVGDLDRHARRLQLDRGAQRRHVVRALAQAAANAEDRDPSRIAHSPLPFDVAINFNRAPPLTHLPGGGKPVAFEPACAAAWLPLNNICRAESAKFREEIAWFGSTGAGC